MSKYLGVFDARWWCRASVVEQKRIVTPPPTPAVRAHCPCEPEPYNPVAENIFSEAKKMSSVNKAYPVPPYNGAPAQLSS